MDYPKLAQRIEKQISSIEKEVEAARKRLEKATSVLNKHESLATVRAEAAEQLKLSLAEAEKLKGLLVMKRDDLVALRDGSANSEEISQTILDVENQIVEVESQILSIRPKLEKALGLHTLHHGNAEKKNAEVTHIEATSQELRGTKDSLEGELGELKTFTPLQDQAKNPILLQHFRFNKNRTTKPNSKFTTYEALFTPPAFRIVPKPDSPYAVARMELMPLEFCVTDPNLIPDWFAEELGLADLSGDLGDVETLKSKYEAVPRLKSLFYNALPLDRHPGSEGSGNFRLMAISGFNPAHDGKLIHTRYLGRDSEQNDRKVLQLFDDAYTALRMAGHKDHRYSNELPRMSASRNRLRTLHAELLSLRNSDPDAEDRKQAICRMLVEEIQALGKATNYNKRSARESLTQMANLADRLGRENLGAARARLVSVIRHVEARLPQIFHKSMFGQEDRHTLEATVSHAESAFAQYREAFEEMIRRLEFMKNTVVFNGTPEDRIAGQRENLEKALFRTLSALPALSDIPPVRPFSLYAQRIDERVQGIRTGIQQRDHALATREAGLANATLELFEIQKSVECLLRDLSLSADPNLRPIAEKTKALLDSMDSKTPSTGPRALLFHHTGAHLSISRKLGEFNSLLIESLAKNSTAEERQQQKTTLKEKLEEIDFEAILGQIAEPKKE